ncbi:transmembrane protease serine 9-like [Drosophila kikkawai]|uniref:Transmembrane protease serine 9-like n=1 Tax=Drosophila kikkawai TaxID=30033 RepID=A0ABM4GB59_DROKI
MKITGSFITLLSFVVLSYGQSSIFLLESECGTIKRGPRERIVNGNMADIPEHPWMAHILTKNKYFVLTAAHCDLLVYGTTVTLGKFDASRPSVHGIQLGLAEVIRHPAYIDGETPKNDIALLRLARLVSFSDYIKPICLTNYQNLLYLDSSLTASGWGLTEKGVLSNVLMRTQLGLKDRHDCSSKFGRLTSYQICAGSSRSDTCQGDSGGPLTGFYYLGGQYRVAQLGIVSFGDTDCKGLGIYTNVMHFFDWIAENIIRRESQVRPAPTQRPKYVPDSPRVAIALLSQAFNMKVIGVLSILLSCAILGYGQNSVSLLEPNCGTPISSSRRRATSKSYEATIQIVGGLTADSYGNPWMAYITNATSACGGSLITNRFVLSAAHCISEPPSPTTVYLGQFDMSHSTPNGIQVSANKQIRHPHYLKTKQDIKNDIALFRLARTVQYTDYIRPICIPTNFSPLDQTTHLTATGWGVTEYGVPSNVLKTTTLTQYPRGTCSSVFKNTVDTSQICAASPSSATCSGDSGGPITSVYPINGRNRVIQLGIVSYGVKYCNMVGVYTNVMYYMGWIGTIIQQDRYQHTPAPTQSPSDSNSNNNDNKPNHPNYPPPPPPPPSYPPPPPPPNHRPPSYGIPYPPNNYIPNGNYPSYKYPNVIYG